MSAFSLVSCNTSEIGLQRHELGVEGAFHLLEWHGKRVQNEGVDVGVSRVVARRQRPLW